MYLTRFEVNLHKYCDRLNQNGLEGGGGRGSGNKVNEFKLVKSEITK